MTDSGNPSDVLAICEEEGYTAVNAENFESFIQVTMGEFTLSVSTNDIIHVAIDFGAFRRQKINL